MSRVLYTGASGFIGSHFLNAHKGDQIFNLDLNPPEFDRRSEYIQGDIRKRSDVLRAFDLSDPVTVISLAAKHHDFGIGHDEYFDTNEDGTRVVCQAASRHGVKRIVFYSSVAVYGIREEISTEELDPMPDSPYGASKLAGEKILVSWANENPSRSVLIIRPTLVFGANNRANMFNLIRQIDSGLYFHLGEANNIKSIAYVENLVKATLFLLDRMKPGVSIYNYADEPQLTSREIGEIIAASLGKKIRLTLPKSVGLMLGRPFDLAIRMTGKNLPISTARIRKLGTQTHHSASKLFSEGFVPDFSTKEGLQKMVDWYKSIR
ncbi:MAG: NAD-dependent epimerase/dehydratase family protein [Cyclobacteriaceae bacterium]